MAEAGSGAWPPPHPPTGWADPGVPGPGWATPGAGWSREPGPRAGVVPLRPLSVSELLDGALATVRRHPGPTLGLAAVVATVQALTSAGLVLLTGSPTPTVRDDGSADLHVTIVGGSMQQPGSLVAWLLAAVFVGAMAVVVADAVLGRRMRAREVWRRVRPRAWALIGLAAVTTVVPLAAIGAVAGVSAALAALVSPLVLFVAVPLGLATVVAAVWLVVRWSLAAPALVLERLGVVAALRRSTALVRGAWWRVLGIRALAAVLGTVVSAFVTTPVTAFVGADIVSSLGSPSPGPSAGGLAAVAVAGALASVLTLPFGGGVRALLYTDQRMRREALDLRLQQAAATGT